MEQTIQQLQKQVRTLKLYNTAGMVLLLLLLFSAFKNPQQKFDIIRAKGLIIEDSAGRDRILLGAPIPYSANRVRTDTALVRKYWAKNFGNPNQYMKWYKDYYHGANGMVVMSDSGFDRVLLGDKLADPNTGKRMFEPAGLLWNDPHGWERGGAGANTTEDGQTRSVVGVDNSGGEAAHIFALEDGTNAVAISGDDGMLLLGFSKKNGAYFENKESFTGMKFFNKKGALVWEQKMNQ